MSSDLSITKNIIAPLDTWNEVYESCHYATYFHSAGFSNIIKDYYPGISVGTRLIEFSDGKKVIFVLYEEAAFKGLLKFNISSVFGVYGGWLSADELSASHYDLLADYTGKLNIFLRINPFGERGILKNLEFKAENTQILDLRRDYDLIHKNYEYRHKYAIRKAKEAGVIFAEATSLSDWKEYYEVYLNSVKRWGEKTRSVYKWSLFESFIKDNAQKIKLYVARYDSRIVAGAVCLTDKRKVLYYHGSYLEEYKQVSPATFLIDQIIQISAGNYDHFDFLPSGGLEGVILFKKGFGPYLAPTPTFTHYTLNYRALNKILKITRGVVQLNFFRKS